MIESLGSLCVLVVLIIIVIIAYDKYMGKSGFSNGPTIDAQQYGPSDQEYSYYTYTGFAGPNMYRDGGGVNPYTLSKLAL